MRSRNSSFETRFTWPFSCSDKILLKPSVVGLFHVFIVQSFHGVLLVKVIEIYYK